MTFAEIKRNDKIYAFKENKLIKIFEFKRWLDDILENLEIKRIEKPKVNHIEYTQEELLAMLKN